MFSAFWCRVGEWSDRSERPFGGTVRSFDFDCSAVDSGGVGEPDDTLGDECGDDAGASGDDLA